ncbi:TAXI family TRAP transporter solute-binding subunit [Candidatus Albibeggiatoa sp. nov. NOAA]|uniref:TAXI family TRAP transporter solute-binding subunit n=1 Tax=Candidatus Albibeggiatoa sp. nov. NOAA TaxID=3162724 RepID=UPI0032FCBD75|nr:TAXI family TRAP transporter solute-binding subunit [Thiotrichaceae bacterium]
MQNSPLRFSLLIIGLAGLIFYLAYQFVPPPPPSEIKIATGREGGAYYNFALQYKQQLAEKFNVKLEIVPTAGSVEAITALANNEVDFAFVQGGVAKNIKTIDKEGLVSVASLFYEPLWVFHQSNVSARYLSDFKGKRIAVGELGSGTRPLAVHRLKNNGVTAENSTFLNIPSAEAVEKLKAGEVDVAFFVTAPTSKWIAELMAFPNIDLMHFERYKAYTRRFHHLNHVEINQGSIDLEKNLPEKDTTLISVAASLLAHKDMHSGLIRVFLHVLKPIHEKGGLLEPSKTFPTDEYLELPLHNSAKHFLAHGPSWLENFFPLGVAVQLERLSIMIIPLLTLLLPLLKGAFPIYRWSIRFKIYRWYQTLRDIDQEIQDIEALKIDVIESKIAQLTSLRCELATQKQASIPLSYMSEFYTLRVHINLILQQLKEQQQHLRQLAS